jgi:hypothetical protein
LFPSPFLFVSPYSSHCWHLQTRPRFKNEIVGSQRHVHEPAGLPNSQSDKHKHKRLPISINLSIENHKPERRAWETDNNKKETLLYGHENSCLIF